MNGKKMDSEDFKQMLLERDFGLPLDGIETDINKRWELGINHHPKSIELMKAVGTLDLVFANDHFCWKWGGDGDNGEILMYLLDIYFEAKDKVEESC